MNTAILPHLATLQRLLADRRSVLLAELQAAAQARAEPVADAQEVGDLKDEASEQAELQVRDAQEERDRDELAQVDAALQRLAAGDYGVCVDCGEPIAWPRLQVQPAAQRCSACAAAWELAAGRGLHQAAARGA